LYRKTYIDHVKKVPECIVKSSRFESNPNIETWKIQKQYKKVPTYTNFNEQLKSYLPPCQKDRDTYEADKPIKKFGIRYPSTKEFYSCDMYNIKQRPNRVHINFDQQVARKQYSRLK